MVRTVQSVHTPFPFFLGSDWCRLFLPHFGVGPGLHLHFSRPLLLYHKWHSGQTFERLLDVIVIETGRLTPLLQLNSELSNGVHPLEAPDMHSEEENHVRPAADSLDTHRVLSYHNCGGHLTHVNLETGKGLRDGWSCYPTKSLLAYLANNIEIEYLPVYNKSHLLSRWLLHCLDVYFSLLRSWPQAAAISWPWE